MKAPAYPVSRERRLRGSGRPPVEASREQLVKALGLTEEQQRKLDPILQESRQQLQALKAAGVAEGERRIQRQGIRQTTREKIREILTPEQRARYDQLTADQASARGGVTARVWVLGEDGKPKPVTLQLGISDGNFSEIVAGELTEGQEVIVGSAERPASRPGGGAGPRLRL